MGEGVRRQDQAGVHYQEEPTAGNKIVAKFLQFSYNAFSIKFQPQRRDRALAESLAREHEDRIRRPNYPSALN